MMKNEIIVYVSGDKMDADELMKQEIFKGSLVLTSKKRTGKFDKRFDKLPLELQKRRTYDLFSKKFDASDGIERKMWELNLAFKKMKNILIENKVQDISFLIVIKNDNFIDFAVSKNMFKIDKSINVEILCTAEFPKRKR